MEKKTEEELEAEKLIPDYSGLLDMDIIFEADLGRVDMSLKEILKLLICMVTKLG